jgi:hypothetical protein
MVKVIKKELLKGLNKSNKPLVKNKRNLREKQQQDPFANSKGTGPIKHAHGTKPARKAKKFQEEMKRKEK